MYKKIAYGIHAKNTIMETYPVEGIVSATKIEKKIITPIHIRSYFPRSEFHCRFPSLFAMTDSVRWSTYHRSDFKKIDGVSKAGFKFLGNQTAVGKGMYPKTGNFYNPFGFHAYSSQLKITEKKGEEFPASLFYDQLLLRQKKMASYVVEQVKKNIPDFSINCDNNYPCILFSLPKPKAEKNPVTWSQLISVYLIALTNKLAYERGINIEMVRRSSFGCLRASVAECGESVRINLGLSPEPYADCVIEALGFLKQLFAFDTKPPVAFRGSIESVALAKTLARYNEARKGDIELKGTLWDTLWAPGDKSNKSFASQFFRKAVVAEKLIDLIFDGLLPYPLNDTLLADQKKCKDIFGEPLRHVLKSIKMKNNALSVIVDTESLKLYEWQTAKKITDIEFWDLSVQLAQRIGAPKSDIDRMIKEANTHNFHAYFENWLARFMFSPSVDAIVTDGYGSDSEDEADIEIKDEIETIYSKKLITATGMRAIQLAYAASRIFLHDTYDIDPLGLILTAEQMYYETDDALSKHPIPIECEQGSIKKGKQKYLSFFDVNHCNTGHKAAIDILSLVEKNARICTLDTTSSTCEEVGNILYKLWSNRPKLVAIITVSSGLKNEQAMSDYNPYGTLRVFSRDKRAVDSIYNSLAILEDQAEYKHPKESHLIRKTAKDAGLTPTNKAILSVMQ